MSLFDLKIKKYDVYVIRQVDNGYLLKIDEEDYRVITGDEMYFDSLSRLISHLTSKLETETQNYVKANSEEGK